jgi:hypothetical protein
MRVHPSKCIQAIAVVFLAVCQAQAAIVADSVIDFSGVQGQDNWQYGYYSNTLDPSGFTQMTVFGSPSRPNNWLVDDVDFWTGVDATGGHPNGSPSSRSDVVQYAVRRWIVESTGTFNISGNLADADLGLDDNGIIGRIFTGNTEVLSHVIGAGDMLGVNYSWTGHLVSGTTVDFVIDPNQADDRSDSTRFTAIIQSVNVSTIPEPTSLGLLCSGCVFVLYRNRRSR